MSPLPPRPRLWPRRSRSRSAAAEAAARALHARDHLERKRARERQRRERERWRAEHARARARIRALLAPVLCLIALGSGGWLSEVVFECLGLRGVALQEVAVQGARTLSPAEIAERAGVRPGQLLSSIEPERVRAALADEPWIASARVLRLPSGVLVIRVIEREAVARWRLEGREEMELIDRRGERFAGRPDPRRPLPLVQGAGAGPARIDEETRALLDELTRHRGLATRAGSVTIHLPDESGQAEHGELGDDEAGYVIQIGESGPRALLGRRRLRQRVARLAALLESVEPTIADARWIDLRYADQAVLRTEPVPG